MTRFLLLIVLSTLTACHPLWEDPKIKGARLIKEQENQAIAIQKALEQTPGFPDHPGTAEEQINIGGKPPGLLLAVSKKTDVSKIGDNHYTVTFTLTWQWQDQLKSHLIQYDVHATTITKQSEKGDTIPQFE